MKGSNNNNIFAGDRAYKTNFFLRFFSNQTEQKFRDETFNRNRYELQCFLALNICYVALNFMQSDCYLLNYCCLNPGLLIISMFSLIVALVCTQLKFSLRNKVLQIAILPAALYIYSTFLDKYSYNTGVILMTLYTCFASFLVQPVWFMQFFYSIFAYTLFFFYLHTTSVHSFLRKPELDAVSDLFIYNIIALIFLAFVEKDRKQRWVLLETFKKSERIFRQIYEDFPSPMLIMDKDQKVLYANKQAVYLLENYAGSWNSCNFSKKRVHFSEIIEKEYAARLEEALSKVNISRQEAQCFVSLKMPEGQNAANFTIEKQNYYRLFISSVVWKNNFAFLVNLRNYSSKKKSEIVNKQSLEGLVQEVEDMIRHCENLTFDKDPNQSKLELLKRVNKLRLSLFNTKILFNTIFEKNEGLKEDKNFAIQKTILDTFATLSSQAKEKTICIQLKFEASFPNIVFGDENLFEQIFYNALSIVIQNISRATISVDCNLESFRDGKLELSFEFEILKSNLQIFEQFLEHIETAKTRTLDNFINADNILYSLALMRPGIEIHEGLCSLRESMSTYVFSFSLHLQSQNSADPTSPSLLKTFESLNYNSTSKPTTLTYFWNEDQLKDSQIELLPNWRGPSPVSSTNSSPLPKRIGFLDQQKAGSIPIPLEKGNSIEIPKTTFTEGLQKLKTETAKNFGSSYPSPHSMNNSEPGSLSNTLNNGEEEEKKTEIRINLKEGTKQLEPERAILKNGTPKIRQKSFPKIVLKKPEELKNIDELEIDVSETQSIQDFHLLYRRYEEILKLAVAKVIMFLIDKYKEQKNLSKEHARQMLERITLKERMEEKAIDEKKLYEKILSYLYRKLENKEFEASFPVFIEEYVEIFRKEIEDLQDRIQVFGNPQSFPFDSVENQSAHREGSKDDSPVPLMRRAVTSNIRDLARDFRSSRKKSEHLLVTLNFEKNKERNLSRRLLLSPSMSTMAKAANIPGRNSIGPFKNTFKLQDSQPEQKKVEKPVISQAEKEAQLRKALLPFAEKDLPLQIECRVETIRKRWVSVNKIGDKKSQKAFLYNDVFTILVVDDSSFNSKAIGSLPFKYKAKVEYAKNGSEAVMKYTHNAEQGLLYHLILMDLQMPIMDGFEATRHIREEENKKGIPQTYICAMSAFEESDAANRAKSIGMNNYCQKPLRVEVMNNFFKSRCEEIGIPLPEQAK